MSDSHVVERAGKILIVSIVLLSVVVIFVSLVHLYAKWFWYRHPNSRRRQQQQQPGGTVLRRGLNPSFLESIPVIPKEFKDGLECAVCLSEVGEGEKTRMLPKCNHGFHVECIDMWFYSHSTCPVCRNPLETQEEEAAAAAAAGDFPTNVLFWGDETQVSSQAPVLTSSQARPDLVIDIPIIPTTQIDCDEDHKSPVVSSRLTRILSGSRRFINPCHH